MLEINPRHNNNQVYIIDSIKYVIVNFYLCSLCSVKLLARRLQRLVHIIAFHITGKLETTTHNQLGNKKQDDRLYA